MAKINVKIGLGKSKTKLTDLEHVKSKVEKMTETSGNQFLTKRRKIIEAALLSTVRKNLSATGVFGPNSHLYQDIKTASQRKGDSLNVSIRIDDKSPAQAYFKIWNYGGKIEAKKSKYLAVPSKDSPYKSPLELKDDNDKSLFTFTNPRPPTSSRIKMDGTGTVEADVRGTLYIGRETDQVEGQKPLKKIIAKFTLVRSMTFKGLHWIENSQKEFIKKDIPKIINEYTKSKDFVL